MEDVCIKYWYQHKHNWALCEMQRVAYTLHTLCFSCEPSSQEIRLLGYGCMPWSTLFLIQNCFFVFFPHKYNTKSGIFPSLNVVHIQLNIGPPREFQIRVWTWFDILGTISRDWRTTRSHSVWVTSSQHPCTQEFLYKGKKPYANFQAYDHPLFFPLFKIKLLELEWILHHQASSNM